MSRSIKKVLIVEDDLSLRPLWESFFKFGTEKYWVEWAVSCEQALAILRETHQLGQKFAIIISDIFLAGSGTGLDLINSPEVKNSGARKIVTSSVSRDEILSQFGHLLADAEIISKPIRFKNLDFLRVG